MVTLSKEEFKRYVSKMKAECKEDDWWADFIPHWEDLLTKLDDIRFDYGWGYSTRDGRTRHCAFLGIDPDNVVCPLMFRMGTHYESRCLDGKFSDDQKEHPRDIMPETGIRYI